MGTVLLVILALILSPLVNSCILNMMRGYCIGRTATETTIYYQSIEYKAATKNDNIKILLAYVGIVLMLVIPTVILFV